MWLPPCFGFLPLCVFHLYRQTVTGSCSASDSSYTRSIINYQLSIIFSQSRSKRASSSHDDCLPTTVLQFCSLVPCAMKALHSAQVRSELACGARTWYSWSRCRGSQSRSLKVHHCTLQQLYCYLYTQGYCQSTKAITTVSNELNLLTSMP
jgi:hypothetical protein